MLNIEKLKKKSADPTSAIGNIINCDRVFGGYNQIRFSR